MTTADHQRGGDPARLDASGEPIFLDPFRNLSGPNAEALLNSVLRLLAEKGPAVRRRPDQLADWHGLIGVMAANMAHIALTPGSSRRAPALAVPVFRLIRTPRRYRNPCVGKAVSRALDDLERAGLARVRDGRVVRAADRQPGSSLNREATLLRPTAAFQRLLRTHGVTLGDLGRCTQRHDPIVLKLRKAKQAGTATWIDYRDTPDTCRMREEVQAINGHLASLDVRWAGRPVAGVDFADRFLSRRFTLLEGQGQRFDQAGRLFGGFWQNLAKEHRRRLLLQGEPVAVVDFNAMFARIAMAEAGVAPPQGDLYAIPGLEALTRPQIKAALNTLMFVVPGAAKAWPKDLFKPKTQGGKGLPPFPRHLDRETVRALVAEHLPGLAGGLNVGASEGDVPAGYRLMHTESEIMVRILLACRERGLAALPLHDGLLVARSHSQEVLGLMTAMAEEVTGYALPVALTEAS